MAEYKFVKELPDDYQCMICTKVLNEPHLTDCCGQHFCQACLKQWFKKQAKKIWLLYYYILINQTLRYCTCTYLSRFTVQISGKVNVSRGRPAGHTWPDVSVTVDTGCHFCRQPAVTPVYRHSAPICTHAADRIRCFLVEQWSAASLIVALSMYLWVTYATSRRNSLDRWSYKDARSN